MDGVEAFAEGANTVANRGGDAGREASDEALKKIGDGVGLEPESEGDECESGGEDHEDDAGLGVLGEMNKEIDAEEDGDSADVEDAFDGPDGELRSEAETVFLGDEIGADELAGASEEGESGKTDDLRRNEFSGADVPNWFEKDLPADGAQDVNGINAGDGEKDTEQVDVLSLLTELYPIERLPGAELEIDESDKNDDNDYGGEMFFHSRGERVQLQGTG